VRSAVIRLRRNGRNELTPSAEREVPKPDSPVDERLFKSVVKTAFNQRRKTLRNALKPLLNADAPGYAEFVADPVFDLRAERLSVEDFIDLTAKIAGHLNG
jgi:16S rRNA (adenine1518-N6/adenine1519-N6)-dimethyltransferase